MKTDPAITWAQTIAEVLGHWCASAIGDDWQQCQSLAELNARWYVASVDEERRHLAALGHNDPRRQFVGGVRQWDYAAPERGEVERLSWTTATGRLTAEIERWALDDADASEPQIQELLHCEIDIWAGPTTPNGQPRLVAAVHLTTGGPPSGEINDLSLILGREDRLDLLLRLAEPLGFARLPQELLPYEPEQSQSW